MKLLLVALAIAFLPARPDSLTLAVAKGTKLTKSNSISIETELKTGSIKIGGRDLPAEVIEQLEMTTLFSNDERIVDEYVSVDGARATELVRRYEKATKVEKNHFTFPGTEPRDEDKTVESPLVDHAVAFTWDPKEEKYARAYRGDEGEKDWLEKLEAEFDYEDILPKGKVEVGDTWKLDTKQFEKITGPGGSLSYPKKSKSDSDPFKDGLKGTIEARYDGKRTVDGRELAVIHLHADVHGSAKPDESAEMPMEVEISLDLEGEYLWDQEHGHLASFELEGPAGMKFSGSKEIAVNEQTFTMELKFELEGTCKLSGRIE